jgi:hypothetical protein
MLKDFVPARANLSTGVTISSPVLERNKWKSLNPSATTNIGVNNGEISGSRIGSEYTDLYDYLYGNKLPYYDGNITGSKINVNSYFVSGNINPYLKYFTFANAYDSWAATGSAAPTGSESGSGFDYWNTTVVSSSYSLYGFQHSEYNILLNNVSQSRKSTTRRLIEFVPGTSTKILNDAELQDSYDTLRTHQLSRYDGVKIYSKKYNNYTSASTDYSGDLSYGKSAVIDRNSNKLGLFTEVTPNKFLPKRNNAILKYLVDMDGNLTELNLRNTHWQEIQNTFVAGNTGSISLFNNQLYSNQKPTNGEKPIFDSGYSYNPILYFGTDTKIYFQNVNQASSYKAVANNSLSANAYINNFGTAGAYPLDGDGLVHRLFDNEVEDLNNVYTPGTVLNFPTYSAVETGNYSADVLLPFTIVQDDIVSNTAVWSLQVYKKAVNGTLTLLGSDTQTFQAGNPDSATLSFSGFFAGIFSFGISEPLQGFSITIKNVTALGYTDGGCNSSPSAQAKLEGSNSLVINAGAYNGHKFVTNNFDGSINSYQIGNTATINGTVRSHNDQFYIGTTLVTLNLNPGCQSYV